MNRLFSIILSVLLCAPLCAQKEWKPTGEWPFINQRFRTATVYSGVLSVTKTIVPCNIHIGNQTLWYAQNDTMMEANRGTIIRVEFPDSSVYVPVSTMAFGRVVREDSIGGQLARLLHVTEVDREQVDRNGVNATTMTSGLLQSGSGFLSSLSAHIADANGGIREEEQPLPLNHSFYILFKKQIFEATEKNILKYINQDRRKEYRNFTRSAEIISTNESSMVKVWDTFFVDYDGKNKRKLLEK